MTFKGEIMKTMKFIAPALAMAGVLSLGTVNSYATVDYTKQTKKPCTTCHVSAKSKDLNEVGKRFAKNKSLDGCDTKK
jgi:hypothetical protein